jgi:hypothetical protein
MIIHVMSTAASDDGSTGQPIPGLIRALNKLGLVKNWAWPAPATQPQVQNKRRCLTAANGAL